MECGPEFVRFGRAAREEEQEPLKAHNADQAQEHQVQQGRGRLLQRHVRSVSKTALSFRFREAAEALGEPVDSVSETLLDINPKSLDMVEKRQGGKRARVVHF